MSVFSEFRKYTVKAEVLGVYEDVVRIKFTDPLYCPCCGRQVSCRTWVREIPKEFYEMQKSNRK